MELLFLNAQTKLRAPPKIDTKLLPKKIALVAAIQYIPLLQQVRKILETEGFDIEVPKLSSDTPGQILGCDNLVSDRAVLCIADGNFHPTAIRSEAYIMHPDGRIAPLEPKTNRQKAAYVKFLSSDRIGVLISTKPGQNHIEVAENKILERKYPNKRFYYFISNQIGDMTDFNFIDCFVNTACPRLADDKFQKPILDISYLRSME
ncbi:2-(3-amino-3-carboxypropyl)histidine synthase subunit [Candidatus Woesearchaeota archaeon]|nr:2-(3-amino-3-carboxypropyl)histidine synthase subunit [Candidatus Woesearchaeota archaeon]